MAKANYKIFIIILLSFAILNCNNDAFAGIVTMTDIGQDELTSVASAVSADGSIVVGEEFGGDFDSAFRYNGSTTTYLGNLGGGYSFARAISADGLTIVGESFTNTNAAHAFKYVGSTMTDIGDLGGDYSIAYGVSANGSVIVGESNTAGNETHAFKYVGTTMTDLGVLAGGSFSSARGVSGDGSVIVGYGNVGGGALRAFKYSDSTMVSLGTLGGANSIANAVSADGSVIVGYSLTGAGENHAFKYIDASSTMIDLGTLGGDDSRARAVSADGSVIVGSSTLETGEGRAFKYSNGVMIDIGTLGGASSIAFGVSADGSVIVGSAETSAGATHAFVYRDRIVDVNNTATSLYYNGAQLNSLINLTRSLIANNLKQDCDSFGANNLCLGASVRYSNVNNNNARQQAAILKAAYKFNDHLRVGFLLDQTFSSNNPSNFKTSNDTPFTMFFANLAQHQDGSGLNFKVAGSYGKSTLDITRSALLTNTEAGAGRANLTSHGFLGQVSYDKKLSDNLNIVPSLGILYSQISRNSYTETSGADFPIYYQALKQTSSTAIAGLNLSYNASESLNLTLGGGLEHDLQSKIDGYAGNISYMGTFNLNSARITNNRAFFNTGASYNIADNQKISSNIYYGKQQFNNAYATMVYLGYMMGF